MPLALSTNRNRYGNHPIHLPLRNDHYHHVPRLALPGEPFAARPSSALYRPGMARQGLPVINLFWRLVAKLLARPAVAAVPTFSKLM